MKARAFHATEVGQKVIAIIGTAEHVALVVAGRVDNPPPLRPAGDCQRVASSGPHAAESRRRRAWANLIP